MISQHKRPKYSLNFKQDAAKLVLEKGYSHQQAADSLGISLSAIRRWVRAEKGCPTLLGSKQANLNLSEHEELIKLRKERANLLMEREILKKAACLLCQGKSVRYQFIDEQKKTYLLRMLCKVMEVGKSAFYQWSVQRLRVKPTNQLLLEHQAVELFNNHKKTLGSRRLGQELNKLGVAIGRFKTRRLMKQLGLVARYPKRYKATTDSDHELY